MVTETDLVRLEERLFSRIEELLGTLVVNAPKAAQGPMPSLLSKRDAARILGCSLTKVKRLVRSGEINVRLVGKRVMVPRSELERLSRPETHRLRVVRLPRRRSPEESSRRILEAIRKP